MKENYYAQNLNAQKLYQVYETRYARVRNGVIVCKDGFRATTHSPEDMYWIGKASGLAYEVTEVDESSVFLIVTRN